MKENKTKKLSNVQMTYIMQVREDNPVAGNEMLKYYFPDLFKGKGENEKDHKENKQKK